MATAANTLQPLKCAHGRSWGPQDFNGVLTDFPKELLHLIGSYLELISTEVFARPIELPKKISWLPPRGSHAFFANVDGSLSVVDLANACALTTLTFPKDHKPECLDESRWFLKNGAYLYSIHVKVIYAARPRLQGILTVWDVLPNNSLSFRRERDVMGGRSFSNPLSFEHCAASNTLLLSTRNGGVVMDATGSELVFFPLTEKRYMSFGKIPECEDDYYFAIDGIPSRLEFRSSQAPATVKASIDLNHKTDPKPFLLGTKLIFISGETLTTYDLRAKKPTPSTSSPIKQLLDLPSIVSTTNSLCVRDGVSSTSFYFFKSSGELISTLTLPFNTVSKVHIFGNSLFIFSESRNVEVRRAGNAITGIPYQKYIEPLAWELTLP